MKHYHSKIQKQNAKNLRNNLTDAEKIMWQYLKNSQFNNLKFRRQQPVGKYIVDFLCCSEKLIIELDGGQNNENAKYDKERDEFLKNEGYRIVRIWNNDIFCNIDEVFDYLDNIIKHPLLTPPLKGGEKNFPKSYKNLNIADSSTTLEGDDTNLTQLLIAQNPSTLSGSNLNSTKSSNIPNSSPALEGRGLGGGCKIQCPAKINLTLKILNKREDGFHNIESIMQSIDLFDYLIITVQKSNQTEIELSGTSNEIPYNEKNLVYKAARLFLENTNLPPQKIDIYIEKNIPVSAGLAGGSTDAAGTIYGLNKIFNNPLDKEQLHNLCAQLGSDLNFCLEGGRQLTKGRGEILEPLEFEEFNLSLIKPKNLGISAKEAYTKFSQKLQTPSPQKGRGNHRNDLEWAIIDDYPELQKIKNIYPHSIMSGSGSTYFIIGENFEPLEGYDVFNGLKSIPNGVSIVKDLS